MLNLLEKIRIFRRTFFIKTWSIFYSQYGEDIVLRHKIKSKSGFYVDVGCWHPKKFSNTWFLYKQGWRGVNIDLGEIKIKTFKLGRPDDINIVAAVSDKEMEVFVETDKDFSVGEQIVPEGQDSRLGFKQRRKMITRKLTEILDQTKFKGQKIDLLNIDAEGHDLQVLNGLDFERYSPGIILIESYVETLDELLKSDTNKLLTSKGYNLFNWVGLTLFYQR